MHRGIQASQLTVLSPQFHFCWKTAKVLSKHNGLLFTIIRKANSSQVIP